MPPDSAILNTSQTNRTPAGLVPVGAYVRLSEDKALKANAASWRREGDQVAVQLEEIGGFAAAQGWYVAKVYNDNNTPASDPLLVRAGFEEMLRDLEAGVIRGICFYHSDRIARLEYDAARINRLYAIDPGLAGRAVTGGTDLPTQEGRSLFMMQATMGGMEVHRNKVRASAANKRLARAGVMRGAPRPFGWDEDRLHLHPEEAEILAAAIRAVPGGKKVGAVRKEWIAEGYAPKRNKNSASRHSLSHSTVEARLVNPRNCGYVTHLPQADRQAGGQPWMPDRIVYMDGKPVMGPWEPIVTPAEWAACVEVIKERKAGHKAALSRPHETAVKYLLSGIARCGKCLFPLTANQYPKRSPSYERYGYRYACLSNLGGCGGVTRVGPPIEELVVDAFLGEVRRSLGATVKADAVHVERLAEVEREIAEVNRRRLAKRITLTLALDLMEELETERAELMDRCVPPKVQRRTGHPALLKEWEGYSAGERKHHLRQDVRAVVVHPQGRGRRPFDPGLIEIEWTARER
ncbi:recombinase family protein [Actinomadura macrotermitis]|uniref:Recombinase domain-containing protein n=1 Tax=Actinomadura macrotermitis TaxID=2585200 RepID=A0A7K0C285_9ACTN|nr:recombinase family protein [Actinomadura macrotermitis]MQY07528.1 hypothetical protein [Actinomadura macrotermitis]